MDSTAARQPAYPDYRIISLIVGCAIFLEQMDGTVLATALPTMARDFSVTAPAMSVAVTSYLLALAILIPVSGAIADRFGTKRVFNSSMVVFIIGSILCSLTHSLSAMVAARLLQGAGGAMMAPVGRLVILRTVERRHLVSSMMWTLIPAVLGTMAGPPLGGFIVQYLDWRWIFYINLPIGVLGFWLVRRYIPIIHNTGQPAPFDWLGFMLCSVGLGCLLFGMESFGENTDPRNAFLLVTVGAAACVAYVRHARQHTHPAVDLTLLRIDSFRLSVISGSLMRITTGAQPFLLPLLLQIGLGFSALRSGQLILAISVGALLARVLMTRLLRGIGFRRVMVYNGVMAALSYAVCAFFRADWPFWLMFGLLVCCGITMSVQFTAYNTIAYEAVPTERMSAANSFYSTLQQLMLSIGVCSGALILKIAMAVSHNVEPSRLNFSAAFLIVALVSLSSTYWHRAFAHDAGHELSGHRHRTGDH
ncbi:DHA2 family efflux MFS transporter permease subunit [Dyella sp. M7H15-1]|uniref:DHA2 family efflux MFS transporter permease subunit n=1 Tax=Dyella sp. M7H15-1 TaxID=2501295 RepID=UPI001F0BCBE0|nr:DHA2 family efflux MFS transporter permease subunit [Dyella sp. M7H15-1]